MMQLHLDKPIAIVAAALIFYFILNQEYHVAWIPVLVGIWAWGIQADLKSTFGNPDMMRYESNRLLTGCIQKYGARLAICMTVSCEVGFIAMLSVLLNRPMGFDLAGFAFVAGVFGAYHFYCARSNYNFKP